MKARSALHLAFSGAVFSSAILLSGCMALPPRPIGRDFPRARFSAFVLQATTLPEVEAAIGMPLRVSTISGLASQQALAVAPGTPVALTMVNYAYAPFGAPPGARTGVQMERGGPQPPAKAATLVFFQGKLVGYDVNSTIPGDDNPPIEEQRLPALEKGATTRAEAMALLGAPTGETIVFDNKAHHTSVMTYSWTQVDEGMVRRKVLKLEFDAAGRFSTYAMVDNSFPLGSGPMPLPFPHAMPPEVPGGERIQPYRDPNHT